MTGCARSELRSILLVQMPGKASLQTKLSAYGSATISIGLIWLAAVENSFQHDRSTRSEDEFMTKAEFLRLARTGSVVLHACDLHRNARRDNVPGYDLGTISRKDVSAMMTPSSMEGAASFFAQRLSPLESRVAGLGFWGAGATCPAGAYASASQGFRRPPATPSEFSPRSPALRSRR